MWNISVVRRFIFELTGKVVGTQRRQTLGETRVGVRISGPRGQADLEMMVDTGATFSKVPESLAKQIGIKADETINVKLSDGTERQRGLAEARLEFDGRARTVPIAIGPNDEGPLLGYTALEILRLKVNPITKKLERTAPIEYWMKYY